MIERENLPVGLVVFDNNGTALDDLHVAYGSVCEIFRAYGVEPPSLYSYRNEITADFMQFYWEHGIPRSVSGDELNVIRRKYYVDNMSAASNRQARYRRDFLPLLRNLRGELVQLAMCSAEQHVTLVDFLVGANLHRFFAPSMITGSAWPKKAPFLLELAGKAKISPQRSVYVGDTADDIEAAKEAGFIAVGFAHETGYNTERRLVKAQPAFLVDSFAELQDLLLRSLL
ncbi:MAG: HAD family hydrolase [Candidatus Pacebacteria bacterium]|nr:HAD family hydrolase [Candidatus Paceibacterota bacterium]